MRPPPVWTRWDAPFLVLLLGATLGAWSWLLTREGGGGAARALVLVAGGGLRRERLELPASGERTIEVTGPLGVSRLLLAPWGARFVASPCPDGVCVAAGDLRRPGASAACVPNRVLVRLEGSGADVDGVTR